MNDPRLQGVDIQEYDAFSSLHMPLNTFGIREVTRYTYFHYGLYLQYPEAVITSFLFSLLRFRWCPRHAASPGCCRNDSAIGASADSPPQNSVQP